MKLPEHIEIEFVEELSTFCKGFSSNLSLKKVLGTVANG